MNSNRILYCILAFLFGCLFISSCVYDYYEYDEVEKSDSQPTFTGFSLNVRVTLDNMGGTRAINSSVLKDFENHIDPEKCRVLFFDNQDRFLFESKSRWVKQLNATAEGDQWLVSVPMYAYGNDVDEDWRWRKIRDVLTQEEDDKGVSFKVAFLVNRPTIEVYTDLETEDKNGAKRQARTFDNSGPHWKVGDTRFGGSYDEDGYLLDNAGNRVLDKDGKPVMENIFCKKLLDLHHTQPDPIYHDKGYPTSGTLKWTDTKLDHFYGFVMGEVDGQLAMSSTSSWVDYGVNNADDSPRSKSYGSSSRKAARTADKSYPIPMYGIQNYGRIKNWIEGVPFNLSSFTEGNQDSDNAEYVHKNVALLRSVVKLELVVPKRFATGTDKVEIDYLALAYSNIYARCEPMDVWTPTDELWKEGHETSKECEWFTLQKYARLVESNTSNYQQEGSLNGFQGDIKGSVNDELNLNAYRRRLSWFYGAWLEKGWPFIGVNQYNDGTSTVKDSAYVRSIVKKRQGEGAEPPHIFNPCIQRNLRVMVDDYNLYEGYADDDMNYHFVVYTGERNSIDPNYLYRVDRYDGYAPTICYWHLGIRRGNQYYLYSFPITKYELSGNQARNLNLSGSLDTYVPYETSKGSSEPGNSTAMRTYAESMVTLGNSNPDLLPWPLMRNHHYTITIGGITRASDSDALEFTVSSTENHSESL